MRLKNRIQGFNLTELMAVIIIIGLLLAISIPIYTTYSQRADMVEATNLIQRQLDIWNEVTVLGNTPSNNIAPAGNWINSIVSSSSNVVTTLNSSTLTFLKSNVVITCTPTVTTNSTTWSCTYSNNLGHSYANYFPSIFTCAAACS